MISAGKSPDMLLNDVDMGGFKPYDGMMDNQDNQHSPSDLELAKNGTKISGKWAIL